MPAEISLPGRDRHIDQRRAAQDLAQHRAADRGHAEQPVYLVDAVHLRSVQADQDVAGAEPGAGSGLFRHHLQQLHAGLLSNAEVAGDPPIEGPRLGREPEYPAPDAAVLHQLAQHPAAGVDGHGKAEPLAPRITAVLIPTTRAWLSTRGPPLLPGFRATSLWMIASINRPSCARSVRPSALTTPALTVNEKPSGLPMATTR